MLKYHIYVESSCTLALGSLNDNVAPATSATATAPTIDSTAADFVYCFHTRFVVLVAPLKTRESCLHNTKLRKAHSMDSWLRSCGSVVLQGL